MSALDRLSAACFAALGPASYWAILARDNAEAVRRMLADPDGELARDRAYGDGGWLACRAQDWRAFATRTDPDLAALAIEAAEEIEAVAKPRAA